MLAARLLMFALVTMTASACLEKPPGTPEPPSEPVSVPVAPRASSTVPASTSPPPAEPAAGALGDVSPTTSAATDPLDGKFTLAEATAGLAGSGPLVATIKTSEGVLRCKLFDDKAPATVANFVGLARGVRPFKSHVDGRWVKRPLYDGTTFHRIIKGFMIQGGDPKGNGTGEPGYTVADEIWPGATHDRAGLLCMANRGRNTNGAQFFVTDAPALQLDGNYTIFGECSPVSVVRAIASVPKGASDRPLSPVTIDTIEIGR